MSELLRMNVQEFTNIANGFFDAIVESGTDDELFASGYFRGHFDLATSIFETAQSDFSIESFDAEIQKSLLRAFDNGELNENDQGLVEEVWAKLKVKLK